MQPPADDDQRAAQPSPGSQPDDEAGMQENEQGEHAADADPPLCRWANTPVGKIYQLPLVDDKDQPVLDCRGKQVMFPMKRREEDGALVSEVPRRARACSERK